MTKNRRLLLMLIWMLGAAVPAAAQVPAGSPPQAAAAPVEPTWTFRLTGNMYFIPEDENYLQPTFVADRHALHLESRYRYEDPGSVSVFGGWTFDFGEETTLSLTPMFGGLFGDVNGIIPALEAEFVWKRLEFYSEGEYVVDLGDTDSSFYYNWSELSIRCTDWLRAGLVAQRTRAFATSRDLQRGLLVGASGEKVEGTFYFFNPGSDDRFYVASIGVKF